MGFSKFVSVIVVRSYHLWFDANAFPMQIRKRFEMLTRLIEYFNMIIMMRSNGSETMREFVSFSLFLVFDVYKF